MKIFVLRHGHAELQKTTDSARKLSPNGAVEVTSTIHSAILELKSVNEVWASPLVRAQQTAKIACDLLAVEGLNFAIATKDFLTPEAKLKELFEALQKATFENVLLVSHQPLVSEFLDTLCGSALGYHSMNTASLACVECEIVAPGLGHLQWLRHVNG